MMKLRLRSFESNQTLKLQFPNPLTCTIAQLKQTLISQIAENPNSIFLSLNKRDALEARSPNDTLISLGITSGDLVYYSFDANAFKISNFGNSGIGGSGNNRDGEIGGGNEGSKKNCAESETLEIGSSGSNRGSGIDSGSVGVVGERGIEGGRIGSGEFFVGESSGSNEVRVVKEGGRGDGEILRGFEYGGGDTDESEGSDMSDMGSDVEDGEEEEEREVESMDVDDGTGSGVVVVGKKFLEQGFLRRVLREELGGDVGHHKLLVIAIHAAFLEAGFVGIDSVSGLRVDRFFLADQWPSLAFGMSLWYTLPEILGGGGGGSGSGECKTVESISLRFQSLGQFVNVYGGLVSGGSGTYRVCLDEGRFSPALDAMWGDRDLSDRVRQNYENEVFEFWKIVKDGLALPLMIDLCEKAGLMPPPCFMCLPTELKFKILESLTGIDIAKVACVSSELKFLSCNSDLWKKKFAEEFGNEVRVRDSGNWKEKFILSWELSKRKRAIVPYQPIASRPARRNIRLPPIIGDGDPLIFHGVVGGDYDRLPGLGVPPPFGRRGPGGGAFLRHPARRNFSPSCNFGGFNV